jgi:hypothetical protein
MMTPSVLCAWCEKPHSKRSAFTHGMALCCSPKCAKARMFFGKHLTLAKYEARMAHLKEQPKGCATIEEWLAAGGIIYRETRPA